MIFVTVGTHEQQFNRLVEYMDKWGATHKEEVIVQTGYSTYRPKNIKWSEFYSYQKMIELVNKARIVITHGGPSSFIMPLQVGKTPIVVPRQHRYAEHVNDHQLKFAKEVERRMGIIIVAEEIDKLDDIINNYGETRNKVNSIGNNDKFCMNLEKIVNELFE